MRERRWGPRLGLGRDHVDPDRATFREVRDVLQYFGDLHTWTHEQLATRCGVGRVPLTRWLNGSREPTLSKLAAVIEPLGWRPMIVLERTEAAVDELVSESSSIEELLGYEVREILRTVHDAIEAGLDVVVGGEVAAVLQGVPVPTRHLDLHVRPDQVTPLLRLADRNRCEVMRLDGQLVIRAGRVSARVVVTQVLPALRMIPFGSRRSGSDGSTPAAEEGETTRCDAEPRIPVVDLAELLAGGHGIGPSVRAIAVRRSRAA
jgi:transcriptional regulator with XRE-family HTH domain